jgi:porin
VRSIVLAGALALGLAPLASAQARFGGPDAVENQLAEDEREVAPLFELSFLDPYREWKAGIQERTGLHFGGDYSALGFVGSGDFGDDEAAGGMVRFFGTWDLVDRGGDHPGALVWKVEHRHAYTNVAPSGLGFEKGYVGLLSGPFSDQRWRTTNLYWRQRFAGGRFSVIGGFLDATDYVDAYAFASPWTGFSNLAFSTGSGTIPLPNDALLGIAGGAMLNDHVYLIAGIGDANGEPEHPFDGFESVVDEHEFFSSVEIGWTSSHERLVLDNVHVTAWHVDARSAAGTPSGWGVNVSASWQIAERWQPFLRAGWAKDGGSLLDRAVAVGVGYAAFGGRDQLGAALHWGRPNEDTFGRLDDQWTFEVFYRWQLLRELAITPDLQVLVKPAQNPDDDVVFVLGLRVRYAL